MTGAAEQMRLAMAELETARRALDRAQAALQTAVQEGVQHPLETPVQTLCDHRRAHRPGRPARIDTDPELRAFILARLDRMTFPDLARAVADAFPPDRRVSKSTIHKWWTTLRRATGSTAPE